MVHDDCMMTGGSFYGWEPLSVGLSRNGVLLWKINGWVYGCLWMDQPQEPLVSTSKSYIHWDEPWVVQQKGTWKRNCKLGCGCQCLTIINKNTQVEYMQSEYVDMPILRFCWSISFYFICRPAHLNGRHFLDRSKTFVIDLETVHVHD